MRVLLVEDDRRLADVIRRGLQEEDILVDVGTDTAEARLYMAQRHYDVVILDRMLPGGRGEDLLCEWRRNGVRTPVLILTALDAVADRVTGLTMGADDYLIKPFAFNELLARVRALSRRVALAGALLDAPLELGDLVLNHSQQTLSHGTRVERLTPTEVRLVHMLMRHAGQTVPRETIVEQAWDEPWEATANTLEVHIGNLRRKLEKLDAADRLVTQRGVRYAWSKP